MLSTKTRYIEHEADGRTYVVNTETGYGVRTELLDMLAAISVMDDGELDRIVRDVASTYERLIARGKAVKA